eukprot:187114_1
MSATSLDLQNWIRTRHTIIDTEDALLTENSSEILKCLGGIQQCLLLLLSSQAILSKDQCDAIKQIISNAKTSPIENLSDPEISKPFKLTLATLDSNSLSHVTQFLSKSEIRLSFKNVCAKLAITGLDEMQKININIVKPTHIEYQYQFADTDKLYESFNVRVPKTLTPRTIFMRIMHEHNMNPSKSAIYNADIRHGDGRIRRVLPVSDMTRVMMGNDRGTVNTVERRKNYMICERVGTIHDGYEHYDPTENLLLIIKYFDIFDQKLYVEYLSFHQKTTIQQFIESISSKMVLHCDNKHTKYEFTNLQCNLRDKLLFYTDADDSLTALDFEGKELLQDLSNISDLCSIAFQLNPKSVVSNYSERQNEVVNAGAFWYVDVCEYIEWLG